VYFALFVVKQFLRELLFENSAPITPISYLLSPAALQFSPPARTEIARYLAILYRWIPAAAAGMVANFPLRPLRPSHETRIPNVASEGLRETWSQGSWAGLKAQEALRENEGFRTRSELSASEHMRPYATIPLSIFKR
jgi:hypothetical protein